MTGRPGKSTPKKIHAPVEVVRVFGQIEGFDVGSGFAGGISDVVHHDGKNTRPVAGQAVNGDGSL